MEENREFPKKQLLSLQLDLSKFETATDEEKAQAVVMRENSRLTSLAVPVKDFSGNDTLCISTVYITGRHPLGDSGLLEKLRMIADDLHEQICFHHISMQDINHL